MRSKNGNEWALPIPNWAGSVILILLVLVAYARVRHAGFIWDDEAHLTENPVVVGPLGLAEIWTSAQAVYYPLVLTTLWLLHKLVGLSPAPYHLLNVLIHGANAAILWRILRDLKIRGAWLGAAIWALHPVMVQSVAWITELKNTQSCLFYLLSILFFLKGNAEPAGRKKKGMFFVVSVLSFILAITSKTATVMLPAVLALCLWWRSRRLIRRDILLLAPYFLISLAAGAWTIWEQRFHSGAVGPEWSQTWPERLIISGRSILFYLQKLIWPHPLIFIYPRWSPESARLIAYLPLLVVVAGLLFIWLKSGSWLKPIRFATSYFIVSLFPVLGFFNVYFFRYSFVSDHFQYLASIGPLALLGAALATGFAALRVSFGVASAACGLLLLGASALTWRQTAIYSDVVTLYEDTLQKNPGCWMAHYNLGIALRSKGDAEGAVSHYRRAIALKPDYVEAHYNLARLLAATGDIEGSIDHYNRALAVNQNDAEAHNNLGVTLARTGRMEEAIAHYRKALAIRPDYADATHNLASALLRTGRISEAIDLCQTALVSQPGDGLLHADLGDALALEKRFEEAAVQYREALKTRSDDAPVQTKLAWLLSTSFAASLRNGAEAVRLADNANHLTGGADSIVLRVLAAAYGEIGDFERALDTARRAREIAAASNNQDLVDALDREIALYGARLPYHQAQR